MLSKLSLRNVKRSFSDYAIYFLTLTFGVSLFYSFNSISAQQIMLDLSSTQLEIMNELNNTMGVISVFISCVMAFLILYANRFLVKRRQKELGIYETLGMSKLNISRLFIMETFVIGVFSLITGIILGVLISQGFSVLTSSLFDVSIISYNFVFSFDAMLKTIGYFAIIFIIVMILNTVVINKFTLLELLYESKKNDSIKIKNTKTALLLFISSVILIAVGYFGLVKFGLSNGIIYTIVFGLSILVGTFLWFYSLTGFLLKIFQNNKKIYYKDLNMFVLRQLNSKINTNFLIMSIICLMLVGTVTILSSGFGYKKAMDEELKIVTPYDVTFKTLIWEEGYDIKNSLIENILEDYDIKLDDLGDYLLFNYYNPYLNASQLIEPYISNQEYSSLFVGQSDMVFALKESDYNTLVKMQGLNPIKLSEDEVYVFTNMKNMLPAIQAFIDKAPGLPLLNKEYRIKNKEVGFISLENTEVPRDSMIVVINDNVAQLLEPKAELLVANYDKGDTTIDNKLYGLFDYMLKADSSEMSDYVLPYTKTYVYEQSQGQTGVLIFIGIYIGIIFLIASAAILTLQQLSEASDNLQRYKILKRIGVNQKGINKVIFRQVLTYFMLPISLAIIHSTVLIIMINQVALTTAQMSILIPAIWTTGILLIVYGGYFLATYKGFKAIVK